MELQPRHINRPFYLQDGAVVLFQTMRYHWEHFSFNYSLYTLQAKGNIQIEELKSNSP